MELFKKELDKTKNNLDKLNSIQLNELISDLSNLIVLAANNLTRNYIYILYVLDMIIIYYCILYNLYLLLFSSILVIII